MAACLFTHLGHKRMRTQEARHTSNCLTPVRCWWAPKHMSFHSLSSKPTNRQKVETNGDQNTSFHPNKSWISKHGSDACPPIIHTHTHTHTHIESAVLVHLSLEGHRALASPARRGPRRPTREQTHLSQNFQPESVPTRREGRGTRSPAG